MIAEDNIEDYGPVIKETIIKT